MTNSFLEETVAVAQQLDLAGQIYSSQADGQVNQSRAVQVVLHSR